jgi:uncharacterized protein YqfB (UPF0267 family)
MKTITLTGKSVYTEIIKINHRTYINDEAEYQFGESVRVAKSKDAFFRHFDATNIYTVTLEEIESTKSFRIISYFTYTRQLELLKREKEMKELMCAEQ